MNRFRTVLTCTACCAALVAPTTAQGRSKGKRLEDAWRKDPYTKLEPAAIVKAGYVSFGPFAWGDDHDTEVLEQRMGESVRLRFVETKHFRIGSALPRWTIDFKEKKRVKRLRAELVRLARKLPRLKPKRIKRLDAWLRLHLYAQRMEEFYRDFVAKLGFDDPNQPVPGMPAKILILLFQKPTSLERYSQAFLGLQTKYPRRYIFPKSGHPVFVTCAGANQLWNDFALHCHVVFNVTHNLVDSYKGHYYQLPVWWGEGLAHWFARRIDPDWTNYSQMPNETGEMRDFKGWERAVLSIVKYSNYNPAADALRWTSYGSIGFRDHLALWSRVDFLLATKPAGMRVFMDGIKGQRDGRGATIQGAEVFKRQRIALEAAWGLDPATLDTRWKVWVKATYPRKRRK